MNLTLTTADLLKDREPVSGTGELIDELAYSAGEATEEDIDPENYAETNAIEYATEHYNYEKELLQQTKTPDRLALICTVLSDPGSVSFSFPVPKNTKHAGAYLALNEPENFALVLEKYTEKCKEEAYQYFGSDFLAEHAPDLAKEIQDGVQSNQKQYHKEWIHGDRSNYPGVLKLIAKYYGAEELEYDEKTGDSVVFTIEPEELSYEYDEKITETEAKKRLIGKIHGAIDGEHAKRTAESAKRKAEYARVSAYKAQRKAQEEAERRAKLEALTK